MISWLEDHGATVTVVLNLDEMRIYSSYSTTAPERIFMTGTIHEVSA
jgi:MoaF-like